VKSILAFILSLLALAPLQARDDGRYAGSELKPWFENLTSGRGHCCKDSDGVKISNADWRSGGGHYEVRLEGRWMEVPANAVITEPNLVGETMVWSIKGEDWPAPGILCFLPGPMT
jgi:hypothetical protein